MKCDISVSLCVLILNCIVVVFSLQRQKPVYLNQFALHVPAGKEVADQIADKHGLTNIGQVSAHNSQEFVWSEL